MKKLQLFAGVFSLLLGLLTLSILTSSCNVPSPDDASEADAVSGLADMLATTGELEIRPAFDITEVMWKAHFAFRPNPETGGYSGGNDNYLIQVAEDGGIQLTPVLPASRDPRGVKPIPAALAGQHLHEHLIGPAFSLRTVVVDWGEGNQAEAPGHTTVAEGGSLAIARGETTEWLANGEQGVEQSWTFGSLVSPLDDLEIRLQVEGLAFAGRTEAGLHFRDPDTGLGFCYGQAWWLDSRGEAIPVELGFEQGEIILRVSRTTLDASLFPATLDPTITPEFDIDEPILIPTQLGAYWPNVATDGHDFFVIWQDQRLSRDFEWDMIGARITSDGEILDPTGIILQSGMELYYMSIEYDGENYLIVWESAAIYGMRVTPEGKVLEPGAFPIAQDVNMLTFAHVAVGGENRLAMWSYKELEPWFIYGINAARLTPDGRVLDSPPISITRIAKPVASPVAAFDGQNYFVVWYDYREGYEPEYRCNVYGARVTSAGQLLDNEPIDLAPIGDYQRNPLIAFDGLNYLVVYNDCRNDDCPEWPGDIYATRVTPTGEVLEPQGIPVAIAGGRIYPEALEFFNGHYYLFWSTDADGAESEVYYTRLNPAGQVLDTMKLTAGEYRQLLPQAAANETQMMAVWIDGRAEVSSWSIYGARFNSDGAIIDPDGFLITRSANYERKPAAAFDGTNYLVVWEDGRPADTYELFSDVYGARITPNGSLLDPTGLAIAAATKDQEKLQVAYTGTQFVVTWEDHRDDKEANFQPDIYAARVTREGAALDPEGVPIMNGEDEYTSPVVAGDGADAMILWEFNGGIWAKRLSAEGAVPDPEPIRINPDDSNNYGTAPVVAYNGANYVVAWLSYSFEPVEQIFFHAARLSPTGEVLDPEPIRIGQGGSYWSHADLAIAGDGENVLVVWLSEEGDLFNMQGVRLTPDGQVLDPEPLLFLSSESGLADIRVTFDGQTWFAVWSDYRHGETAEIYGLRIDRNGVVLDPGGLAVAAFDEGLSRPEIAGNPAGQELVVYSHQVNKTGFFAERVRGRLIQTDNDNGHACNWPADCTGGFCVDGVCCNEACGGGLTDDCQACSRAAGASQDGTCEALPGDRLCSADAGPCDQAETCDGVDRQCPADHYYPATHACRPAGDLCDAAEYCSGEEVSCPADEWQKAGYTCRPARSACDLAETCSGADIACPADQVAAADVECRPAAGACDEPEVCDGENPWCPADAFYEENRICRPATGDCDQQELCPGDAADCPADLFRDDGSLCEDGLFCNGTDSCLAGACTVHEGYTCADDGQFCNGAEYCEEESDRCRHAGDPCGADRECSESLDECLAADDDDVSPNDDDDTSGDDDDESPPTPGGNDDDDEEEESCGGLF